jgi:hypothetical protein
MATNNIKLTRIDRGLVNVGKILLRVLGILLVAYLAFFCYVAFHEWAGHIFVDMLMYAKHGTYLDSLKVIVQWLSVALDNGHWTVGLESFRFGGITFAAPHDLITLTKWENGFPLLWGSGITTLVSLIFLTALNLRRNIRRFPWFAGTFVLSSVVFDQIFNTFTGPNAEALSGAVQMGITPIFFKGLVIALILLQGWLLANFVIRYRRSRRVLETKL